MQHSRKLILEPSFDLSQKLIIRKLPALRYIIINYYDCVFFAYVYSDAGWHSSVVSARDEHVGTDTNGSLRHAATTAETPRYGGNADAGDDDCSTTWHAPSTTNAHWIWGVLADMIECHNTLLNHALIMTLVCNNNFLSKGVFFKLITQT